MIADILQYKDGAWDESEPLRATVDLYSLVIVFADRAQMKDPSLVMGLKEKFPAARVVIGSTAGEIIRDSRQLGSAVAAALQFDHTAVKTVCRNISDSADSYELGKQLASDLPSEGLKYVYVLSDGSLVNGSQLILGINEGLPKDVLVTGGMAGDGDRFQATLTGLDEDVREGNVILVGLYGERILVGYGTRGGWLYLGPDRTITSSAGNILYEIDGQPALDLYKKYLGSFADELPGSALLFPLALLNDQDEDAPLVRTILSIDEANKSMIFAGDVPMGARVRLMRAGLEELVKAAGEVGAEAMSPQLKDPAFGLVMNCVGRRLVLGHRAEEELESIRTGIKKEVPTIGFYSYGEFSPMHKPGMACNLHNQTVVLTIFEEN
ncbi:MAG: hypothetical protein RLZZ256_514 [Bacteroidota bacterium]